MSKENKRNPADWVTMTIPKTLKDEIVSHKLIPEEPHYKVLKRIVDFYTDNECY